MFFKLNILLETIRYHNIIMFLKYYKYVGKDTIHINNLDTNPLKIIGIFLIILKRYHNMTPLLSINE